MARFDLGLPEEEIGRLTLLEFDALVRRKHKADNTARLNAGIIAAAIYNSAPFADANRRIISPYDFVDDRDKADTDLTTMSPQEQKAYFISIFCKAGYMK